MEIIPEKIKEEKLTKTTNQIQIDLIRKSNLKPEEWIEKYARSFRELIEKEPDLLIEYQKDKELGLEKIERLLNQEVIH